MRGGVGGGLGSELSKARSWYGFLRGAFEGLGCWIWGFNVCVCVCSVLEFSRARTWFRV